MRSGVLYLLVLLFLSACIKTNCEDTICLNGGVCVQSSCACLAGYEGEDCSKLWSDKYGGSWQAADNYQKDTAIHNYAITITTPNKDSFVIKNMLDSFSNVYCVREGKYTFNIISATSADSTLTISEGSGTYDESKGIVTGLYSFSLNDSNITTYFTWKK